MDFIVQAQNLTQQAKDKFKRDTAKQALQQSAVQTSHFQGEVIRAEGTGHSGRSKDEWRLDFGPLQAPNAFAFAQGLAGLVVEKTNETSWVSVNGHGLVVVPASSVERPEVLSALLEQPRLPTGRSASPASAPSKDLS